MKITPALVPHNKFHRGIWLLSTERPGWYYFMKKKNPNTITNKIFMRSIDKPLRKLVRFLHKQGIKTTPSCSGHHFSERDFGKIYDWLEEDKNDIKTQGLKLKDIETNKTYLLKNPNYRLPWTKEDFMEKAVVYQKRGVIGFKLGNRKKMKEQILKLHIKGTKIEERDNAVLILTRGSKTGENGHVWRSVTKAVMDATTKEK
jgi:hypothetical protein